MKILLDRLRANFWLVVGIGFLLIFSYLILYSISPVIYPQYFLFIVLGIILFLIFARLDFDILQIFSWHMYVGSIIFLSLPLLIGQVTRGAVRWIPIGAITVQPAEIVRPFLIVFFSHILASDHLKTKQFIKALALLALPVFLILVQPSLGVSILTIAGFLGVLLASTVDKKAIGLAVILGLALLPFSWFILAPYQKVRVASFIFPQSDPAGAGYNSIQSMIAVGSGKFLGRGLGEGVQTQLDFLPERHTDFIFASTAEEMGFVGALFLIIGVFFVLYRVVLIQGHTKTPQARAFISGIFLTLFVQSMIHIGMNMGVFPITGVPLPLVSAGGSSLLATMVGLGMVVGARKY